MDSKVVHYEIVKEKMDRNWRIWPIIRDIRRMLNQIQEKQVKVIRRNANRAADWQRHRLLEGCAVMVG